MKVSVDRHRCEGHGLCADQASAVFSLDDAAQLIYAYEGSAVPDQHIDAVHAAINSCPVAALRVAS